MHVEEMRGITNEEMVCLLNGRNSDKPYRLDGVRKEGRV